MKKTITIAASRTKVNTQEIEIDYPEQPKYYEFLDESSFFGRGAILFAIIPKYSTTFIIVEVIRGQQT